MIEKRNPPYANFAYTENHLHILAIDTCSGKTAKNWRERLKKTIQDKY